MKAEIKLEKIKLENGKTVFRISGRNLPIELKNEIISEFGLTADFLEVNVECNTNSQISEE
jgi:hypothetical protein